MADARIAGDSFGQRYRFGQPLLLKQFLNAAMFPEMAHFELHDGLAGHRKSEMARFNDARMDGTDGNLEDPLTVNFPESILPLHPS